MKCPQCSQNMPSEDMSCVRPLGATSTLYRCITCAFWWEIASRGNDTEGTLTKTLDASSKVQVHSKNGACQWVGFVSGAVLTPIPDATVKASCSTVGEHYAILQRILKLKAFL